jgi:hypothetical protein
MAERAKAMMVYHARFGKTLQSTEPENVVPTKTGTTFSGSHPPLQERCHLAHRRSSAVKGTRINFSN